ncbi:hypothetical protein [Actinomadura gamaensis]|uniref:Uncharacterized protein n=1 Tax=Actinomadura gamaensis TaxID=1763541 RepID=A0ABV9U9S4_9ACTN
MSIFDARLDTLRAGAEAGDLDAALELGRLLCLLPVDPADLDRAGGLQQSWSEERRLRTVAGARPGDRLAANLLAGCLTRQIHHLRDTRPGDRDALTSRRLEAERLYVHVLAAHPDDPTARAGLARLGNLFSNELPTAPPGEYGYYLAECALVSGSGGTVVTFVHADADELRWALDLWLRLLGEEMGEDPELDDGDAAGLGADGFTLTTVVGGRALDTLDLEAHMVDRRIDWDALSVPPLSAPPLPPGHPGRLEDLDYDHGYSETGA